MKTLWREGRIKPQKRELKDFLICNRKYYSEEQGKYIYCRNTRHRDQKMCNWCEDNPMKKERRQKIYPHKDNDKNLVEVYLIL